MALALLPLASGVPDAGLGQTAGEAEEPPRRVYVEVGPRSGGPRTRFRIAFRARDEATGPRYCGEVVAFRAPRRSPASWCPGIYEGIVFLEREQPEGGTVVERHVGEFTFRVTRPGR